MAERRSSNSSSGEQKDRKSSSLIDHTSATAMSRTSTTTQRDVDMDDEDKPAEIWNPKTDGPRKIEVSITVQSVENICTTDETVDVGLLLDVYWLPTPEEKQQYEDNNDGAIVLCSWDFHGNFQTVNAIQDSERDVRKEKRVRGVLKWYAQLWISSTFKQDFDLRAFPLDCQRLVVRFEMGNVEDMIYSPPIGQPVVCSVEKELCPCEDWMWQGATVVMTGTDPGLSKQGNSYAQMILVFHLARQWMSYVWRMCLLNSFLCWSSLDESCGRIFGTSDHRTGRCSHPSCSHLYYSRFSSEYSVFDLVGILSISFNFGVAFETSIIKGIYYKFGRDLTSVDDVIAIAHFVLVVAVHVLGLVYCCMKRRQGVNEYQKHRQGDGLSRLVGSPVSNIKVMGDGSRQSLTTSMMSERRNGFTMVFSS